MAFNKQERMPLTHFKCDNNNNITENQFLKSTVNHNSSLEDNWVPQQIILRKKRFQSLFTYWKFLQNLILEDGGKHKVQVLVFCWPRASSSCPGAWALHFGAPCPVGFSHQGEWRPEKTKVGRVLPDSAGFSGRQKGPPLQLLLSSELQLLPGRLQLSNVAIML